MSSMSPGGISPVRSISSAHGPSSRSVKRLTVSRIARSSSPSSTFNAVVSITPFLQSRFRIFQTLRWWTLDYQCIDDARALAFGVEHHGIDVELGEFAGAIVAQP